MDDLDYRVCHECGNLALMQPLNVLVDDQVFLLQNAGGISRYFAELAHAFGRDPELGVEMTIPLGHTTNTHLQQRQLARPTPLVSGARSADLARRIHRRLSRSLPRDWRTYDLIHHSYYLPAVLQNSPGAVRAVTIHDMIPEAQPQWFNGQNPHAAKRAYVSTADVIICVSEATRQSLLDLWGPIESPIHVIPLAAGLEFHPRGPVWQSDRPFLLFVGRRDVYKDFDTLLTAFSMLAQTFPELVLTCVGGGPFNEEERTRFSDAEIADRVERIDPSDSVLAGMYRGADAFVFPSHIEGFGLPTLESLACGTPTVLADIPVFREIAQDAAVYFTPGDPSTLIAALEGILEGDRDRLRAVALERASHYSWDKTAELTALAYNAALGHSGGNGVV